MALYRVFLLDSDDKISATEYLFAETDDDAVNKAAALLEDRPHFAGCELWHQDRMITRTLRKT